MKKSVVLNEADTDWKILFSYFPVSCGGYSQLMSNILMVAMLDFLFQWKQGVVLISVLLFNKGGLCTVQYCNGNDFR
jgi:hypothetical protein